MADKKISQLDPIAGGVAKAADILAIVDSAAVGVETNRIYISELMGTPGPIGGDTPDEGTFTALQLATGPQVDEISTDTNLGTNDDVLPTQNAVKQYVDNAIAAVSSAIVNPVHASSDSTAVVGDVVLVDTTTGDINIEMVVTPKGRITVIKTSPDSNSVIVTPQSGSINGETSMEITTQWETYTFVTDTNNFYIV
jgi:hypothetical protein